MIGATPRWKLLVELAFFGTMAVVGGWWVSEVVAGTRPLWWLPLGAVLIIVNTDRFADRWRDL